MAALFRAVFEFQAGPPAEPYTARQSFLFSSADAKSIKRADVRASYAKARAKAKLLAPRKFKAWGEFNRRRPLRLVELECVG